MTVSTTIHQQFEKKRKTTFIVSSYACHNSRGLMKNVDSEATDTEDGRGRKTGSWENARKRLCVERDEALQTNAQREIRKRRARKKKKKRVTANTRVETVHHRGSKHRNPPAPYMTIHCKQHHKSHVIETSRQLKPQLAVLSIGIQTAGRYRSHTHWRKRKAVLTPSAFFSATLLPFNTFFFPAVKAQPHSEK